MGGPWFTVQESGDDWQVIETIWISDGQDHVRARLEIRIQLEEVRA